MDIVTPLALWGGAVVLAVVILVIIVWSAQRVGRAKTREKYASHRLDEIQKTHKRLDAAKRRGDDAERDRLRELYERDGGE